jgi:hypothetical protein
MSDDPSKQEQVVRRSPVASHTDEHAVVTTTQSSGGLGGGSPAGGPEKTPEREAYEREHKTRQRSASGIETGPTEAGGGSPGGPKQPR